MVGWRVVPMSSTEVDVALPGDLVEFIESGVSMLVGTRDAGLRPECMRGSGATVARDRRSITLLLNELTGTRTLENVKNGSPIAITFSRPMDHRTVQVKGRVRTVRPGTPAEHQIAQRYLSAFVESLYAVGMSRALSRRMRVEPCVAVELEVMELFQQTPGPDAGKPLVRG